MTPEPIIREVMLHAPPEDVFDAYTSIAELKKWFAHTAEIDLRPGGAWRFTWPPAMAASGHVVAVERPHLYVWTWEESIEETTRHIEAAFDHPVVTNRYTFTPQNSGTVFRIEESGHGTEDVRAMNEPGIDQMIETLRAYLELGEVVDWSITE